MLDAFYIFTKGGIVLWSFSLAALKGNPVDALIRSCLLEERAGESSYAYTSDNTGYTLKWSFHNELELVFVAVRSRQNAFIPRCVLVRGSRHAFWQDLSSFTLSPHLPVSRQVFQRVLQLSYVDDLLAAVNKQFTEGHYRPSLRAYPEFEDEFRRILSECERKSEVTRKARQISNFDPGKKAREKAGNAGDDDANDPGRGGSSASLAGAGGSSNDLSGTDASPGAFDLSKLKSKSKKDKGVSPAAAQSGGKGAATTDEGKKKKARKKAHVGAAAHNHRVRALSANHRVQLRACNLSFWRRGSLPIACFPSRRSLPRAQKDRVWNGNAEPGAKLDFSDKPPEGALAGAAGGDEMPVGRSAMDIEEESSTSEEDEEEGEGRVDGGAKASKSGGRCV